MAILPVLVDKVLFPSSMGHIGFRSPAPSDPVGVQFFTGVVVLDGAMRESGGHIKRDTVKTFLPLHGNIVQDVDGLTTGDFRATVIAAPVSFGPAPSAGTAGGRFGRLTAILWP